MYKIKGLNVQVQARTLPSGHIARPNFGIAGEPITVLANHFKLDMPQALKVWQYDVTISKRPPSGTALGGAAGSAASSGGLSAAQAAQLYHGPGGAAAAGLPESAFASVSLADVAAGGACAEDMPPKALCCAVLNKLAQDERWPVRQFAYDQQKLLFTASEFLTAGDARQTWYVDPNPNKQPASAAAQPARRGFYVSIQRTAVRDIAKDIQLFFDDPAKELPRECMQALDIAAKADAAADPDKRIVGRGVYSREGFIPLKPGTEAWQGYTQTVALTQSGPSLVMDASRIAMPQPMPIVDYIRETLKTPNLAVLAQRPLTPSEIDAIRRKLNSMPIKICVTHRTSGKTEYVVKGITDLSARALEFQLKDGPKTTVERYFKDQFGLQLRYPNLPCVIAGSAKRPDWLPVEFCKVTDFAGPRRLLPSEVSDMIKSSAEPVGVRMKKIVKYMLEAKFSTGDACFGMKLDTHQAADQGSMMQVHARVLPQPCLDYQKKGAPGGAAGAVALTSINPGQQGAWDLRAIRFLKPANVERLGVAVFINPEFMSREQYGLYMQELHTALTDKGLTFGAALSSAWPPEPAFYNVRKGIRGTLQEAMDKARDAFGGKEKLPPQLLLAVQPEINSFYRQIKFHADVHLGVLTQCVVPKGGQLLKNAGSIMKGIALKINTKLGGENTKISGDVGDWCPLLQGKKVMFLGADVSHPTNMPDPARTDKRGGAAASSASGRTQASGPTMPSVAAVVGSTNRFCTRYAARVFGQAPLQEALEPASLTTAVVELVRLWSTRNNRHLPDVLIMFRDGVSEGQFDMVLQQELPAIRAACRIISDQVKQPYAPSITLVTVQKRHSTRLFPDPACARSEGPSSNVRPGTVVDRHICHPHEFDFYLNSHAGLQGTNKAAKYSVLHDQNNFSADSMQLLAYWLCHTFCRCPRTVSLVPPAYYAHHAAYRGRLRLKEEAGVESDSASETGSATGSANTWQQARGYNMHALHPNLLDEMYYI